MKGQAVFTSYCEMVETSDEEDDEVNEILSHVFARINNLTSCVTSSCN